MYENKLVIHILPIIHLNTLDLWYSELCTVKFVLQIVVGPTVTLPAVTEESLQARALSMTERS